MKRLLLVINEDRFFLSHRLPIALKAIECGWEVTLVAKNTGFKQQIERYGIKFVELPMNPTGMNPKEEFISFKFLLNLFKNNKDSIVHLVGLKNMLWGGLASKIAHSKGVLYAVSGLGTLFGENSSKKLSYIIQRCLKFSMAKNNVAVIFQNRDDEILFRKKNITANAAIFYIKGSGVDLEEYSFSDHQENPENLKIIFTGRMLKEKGVIDLVEAARLLKPQYYGKIQFLLCGDLSSNPSALKKEDMERMTDNDYICWLGHRNDIPELLQNSHIMCFPSYYREGLPKSLIEASACGLPIVTTDSTGCRDTVKDGINGFIVTAHSPHKIAKALKTLIDNPELRLKMGLESRKIAERDYSIQEVVTTHLDIYNFLSRS